MARRRGAARGKKSLALVAVALFLACAVLGSVALVGRGSAQGPEPAPSTGEGDGDVRGTWGGDDTSVTDRLQLPEGMDALAEMADGGQLTTREEEGDVATVSSAVLASYRDQGDCVLASSGYLDLYGSVWSCVVRGGLWADVCVVSACEDRARCQVMVLRMERDEVMRLLEQGGP